MHPRPPLRFLSENKNNAENLAKGKRARVLNALKTALKTALKRGLHSAFQVLKKRLAWLEDRLGLSALLLPMLQHRVPPNARWAYVFGSATLAAFALQLATGVALAFAYVPSSGEAFEALRYLTDTAPLGWFLRGLHYFGASAMVFFLGVHALQVFLFGAYKFPRELNWITGVLLLGLTLGMGFTGQLLRWDQTAVWSVVVAAEQAGRAPILGPWLARLIFGGDSIGGATLTRFFALHGFVLPALILATVGAHLHLVLRHGISEPPTPGRPVEPRTYRRDYEALLEKEGVPFWPDAAWRDVLFGALVITGIFFCAWQFGPPALEAPPDPSLTQANPRPDWYLLWYFAVLALLPPGLERPFMILAPALAGTALLALPLVFPKGERNATRRPWAMAGVIGVLVMIGSFWLAGARSRWSPDFSAQMPAAPGASAAGVTPTALPLFQTATAAPISEGARLFELKACIRCHQVDSHHNDSSRSQPIGGRRGPALTGVGGRLTRDQITLRILNGGVNMPPYAHLLKPEELAALNAFLEAQAPAGK